MTERPWERGQAEVTWLRADSHDGQVREMGLGWVSRARDPFDRRETGEVAWAGEVEHWDAEAKNLLIRVMTSVLGMMQEQLGSEDTLPVKRRWDELHVTSTSLETENSLAVREIGLTLFYRSPAPFDLREHNQVTWTEAAATGHRETVLANLGGWLGELRWLQGAE